MVRLWGLLREKLVVPRLYEVRGTPALYIIDRGTSGIGILALLQGWRGPGRRRSSNS